MQRLLVFDRAYACRLDRKWLPAGGSPPPGPTAAGPAADAAALTDTETMQLIMGMTYSLKNLLGRLAPEESGAAPASRRDSAAASPVGEPEGSPPITLASEHCYTYVCSKYRLTYYESVTGWRLCLLSEPAYARPAELEALMRGLYNEVFVRHVVQNPAYRLSEASLERPGLLARLDEYLLRPGGLS